MIELRTAGAKNFAAASKALRQAGPDGKGLRKELAKAIQRSTKRLKSDGKRSAMDTLPSRGGLARDVAASKLTTKTRGGGDRVGVRIVATGKKVRDLAALDDGELRHPVFHTSVWVTQRVPPGWFTKPMEAGADAVRKELVWAIDAVIRKIAR